jgi:raffinose/stachyose/melibiose transport system permease protein
MTQLSLEPRTVTAPEPDGPAPTLRRPRRRHQVPWWFLIPALVIYTIVVVVPDLQAMVYAFTNWDGLTSHFDFVGFDNFVAAFRSPYALSSLVNTLLLTAAVTVVQLIVGLLLALALNSPVRSRNVLRAVFFAPVVLTSVAVGYIWKYMYAPTGALNQILDFTGLSALKHDWLGDPSVNLWAIAFLCVWQSAGFTMVIFLAGLQGVDSDLIEAAHLDGAGPWARFWYVVRPLLAPAILVNAVLCVSGGLKIFDQIYITTQGGPAHTTATLATLTYTDGFVTGDYSFGVTLSVILTVLVSVVTIVQFRLMNRKER